MRKARHRGLDYEMLSLHDMKHTSVVEGSLFSAQLCSGSCGENPVLGESLRGWGAALFTRRMRHPRGAGSWTRAQACSG